MSSFPLAKNFPNKHSKLDNILPILQIVLEPSEFVIEISGTFGPYGQFPSIIKSLMLVTNLRTYGPFGQLHGTPFHSRVKKNGSIVGFFGCSGEFLDAIGVYIHH